MTTLARPPESTRRWGAVPDEPIDPTTTPPKVTGGQAVLLKALLVPQISAGGTGITRYLHGRRGTVELYQFATNWTRPQCETAAVLDLILWQREAIFEESEPREARVKRIVDSLGLE